MTNDEIRTFVCFEISPALREYLQEIVTHASQLREAIVWTRASNIHLTLKFLGNVERKKIPVIADTLEKVANAARVFQLTVDRVGAFPDFRRPRVFWVGCRETPVELQKFVAALEDAFATLGFAKEARSFTPHLTLGRTRGGVTQKTGNFLENFRFVPHKIDCNDIILMQSELAPTGAVYTPLKVLPLQKV